MRTLALVCTVAVVVVCAVGTAGTLATAAAQFGRNAPPSIVGMFHAVVGSGAVYENDKQGTKQQMEVAVLGKESAGGKDAVWVEISVKRPERPNADVVIKELVAFDATANTIQPFKAIMQMPNGTPMEMPDMMVQRRQPIQYKDVRTDYQDLGSESVTTPAGTFSCEHYRTKDGSEAWVSEKVVPFSLVKGKDESQTTTLVKLITDAKDKIVGTPQPFDPMKMMQQMQQQPQ